MKWLFLVNNASFLFEFLGKVAHQLTEDGEECFAAVNSKIAEYEKTKFFPKNTKFISKVDWTVKNYDNSQKNFSGLSWRELFTAHERFALYDKYGYDKSFTIVNQLYQFFSYIFEKEKPDVVIGEPPAGLFGLVAYYFCKKNNITFCGIAESRFPGRVDIYDLEWTYSKFEKKFKGLKKDDFLPEEIEFARDFIEKFISHETIYSSYYLCKVKFGVLEFITHYLKKAQEYRKVFWQYFLHRNQFKDFDYESEAILDRSFKVPFVTMIRNLRILFQKNVFDKLNLKNKYFFFPLHCEPEASTLVLATYYYNQLATVKNAAITLPFPYKLYVKEHPISIGARSNNFYKEIKKMPNVVLLSSEEPTQKVIAESAGVITMTSTVGMEAAMQGKPVYVLGNVFYSYHPLCKKIVNFEDLEKKLRKDLNQKTDTEDLKELNMHFIISYLRSSILANIFEASQREDKNDYKIIYKEIKKWVLEQKNEKHV